MVISRKWIDAVREMVGAKAAVQVGDLILDKYRIDRVLGQGGMGVVVQASHMSLGNKVAIKFLLPDASEHPEAVARFLREARAAVQIQSEHVARVSDVGTMDSGLPYMVLEFLEGNDLAAELEKRGALPVEEVATFMLQALEAIGEAHALQIVHRDLKPANLFLATRKDGSRIVKVLDFGISKAIGAPDLNLTQTATMMGSPLYMAPEQIRNVKTVDTRADVWSLGVILHESLSGRPPFGGPTLSGVLAAIVADPPLALAKIRPELPAGLSALVAECLKKDPMARIQDVGEMARLLSPFAPDQAQRSLPKIAALIGKTLPYPTTLMEDKSAPWSETIIQGARGEATLAGHAQDAGVADSMAAQTWSQPGDATRTRSAKRWLFPLVLLASALVLALFVGGSMGTGEQEAERSSLSARTPEAPTRPIDIPAAVEDLETESAEPKPTPAASETLKPQTQVVKRSSLKLTPSRKAEAISKAEAAPPSTLSPIDQPPPPPAINPLEGRR